MGAVQSAFEFLWRALTGTPQQHNDTHEEIRRREELERQQRAERERMEREHREAQEKTKRELEQKAREERERIERQQQEEKERHENEMRKAREETERREKQLKEDRERHERQQREAKERHENEMRKAREEETKRREKQLKEDRERNERQQREANERHENAMRKAREETMRQEQQLKEDRERHERQQREANERHENEMRKVREENERQEAAAREEREQIRRKALERAEEERLRHEQEKRRLEEESRARLATQAAEAERVLQEQEAEARRQMEELNRKQAELQSKYLAGIQPEVWPTPEERKSAEEQLVQPSGEYIHCAIAGLAGSGKSSLINALRGLRNSSTNPAVAPTGVTETTMKIAAYRDPATAPPRSRFVWYDVPGAGTSKIKGWQYFNSQGLFVFDLILVVIDNRFSEQDLIILQHCERYKIPSFIVRSKANQHILNTMSKDYEWEGSDDEREFSEVYLKAREKVSSQTRANYRENLREGGLDPDKPVYIVSCDALASLVLEEKRKLKKENQLIDEAQLLLNCLQAVKARRFQGLPSRSVVGSQ